MHIERTLLLNQTSCEIPFETSHSNSLRQASYCNTNHPVILGNVWDPYFKTLLMPNQDWMRISHRLAMHCCGKLEACVSVDSLEFSCRYSSASRPVTSSNIFIHIKVLLVKWKTLHLESFFNYISLRSSLVQRFLLYIL